METNRILYETVDNHEFDDLWSSLIDTQTGESQAIQQTSNSMDSIHIVEQGDHFQLNGDFVPLIEEVDFSCFLDTSNKHAAAIEVDETVTSQDTTEQAQATNHTNELSHSNQERTYNQHPYPPISTLSTSSEHDQPYFTFSSWNMHDLIAKYGFDLTGLRTRQRRNNSIIRLNTHGHAILTQTETSKEDIMNVIHHEFPDSILKYACIGEISQSKTTKPTLGIQIILRKVVNRRVWFLDSITNDPNCNYHVTTNDRPWNYYIKQANKFLEYGTFRSVHSRSKTTSSSISTSIHVNVSPSTTITTPTVADHEVTITIPSMPNNQLSVSNTLTKTIDQNRSVENYNNTANRAMELAKEDINTAMDLMRKEVPSYEFLIHSAQYLATFQYIQNRSQRNTTNEAALHTHSMILHHHH